MCKFVAAVRNFAEPLMQRAIWSIYLCLKELKSVIIFTARCWSWFVSIMSRMILCQISIIGTGRIWKCGKHKTRATTHRLWDY
ncbi:hypothetical protein Fmac_002143 [Flemingia macrophylla]|uniref:Uncharacterized protein n=1 Tax=Flemingia macrophylla TaxID=520843 RepID=A0ABD1NJW2_9FABA